MRVLLRMLPILCCAITLYLTTASHGYSPAHAQLGSLFGGGGLGNSNSPSANNLQTIGPDGKRLACKGLPEAQGGVLLGSIVPCLSYTIQTTTQQFSKKSIAYFKPLFYSFLVLMITLFGVKITQGEQEVHQQGIMLLVKIALVIGVLEMIPTVLVPASYNILDESVSVVASSLGNNGSGIKCDLDRFGGPNTALVWKQMDCVMGKLYGYTTGSDKFSSGSKAPNMVLASSMLGLLAGFAFGGTLALTVFFMCIGVLVTIFMVVMRVALSFVNSYLIISVMMILAPIFLPLAIMQSTSEYFTKWWKIIMGAFILPVIMTAYAVFALQLYDRALFADDSLVNKLFEAKLLKEALAQSKPLCNRDSKKTTENTDTGFAGALVGSLKDADTKRLAAEKTAKEKEDVANSALMKTGMQGTNIASEDPCALIPVPKIEFDKIESLKNFKDLDGKAQGVAEALKSMFNDLVKLVIIAFLVKEGADTVTSAVRQLVGSSTVGQALNHSSSIEAKFQQKGVAARQAFNESMRDTEKPNSAGVTGAKFMTNLGPALGSGAGAFIKRQ